MSSFASKVEEARRRLPLRRLMEQRGKSPPNGNWKAFAKCPYCNGEGGVGLFGKGDWEQFKCWHANCPTGTNAKGSAWDEIGFLAYELGLNRKDASVAYLKEAGLWEEARHAPSILPGKSARKTVLPPEVLPNPVFDLPSTDSAPRELSPAGAEPSADTGKCGLSTTAAEYQKSQSSGGVEAVPPVPGPDAVGGDRSPQSTNVPSAGTPTDLEPKAVHADGTPLSPSGEDGVTEADIAATKGPDVQPPSNLQEVSGADTTKKNGGGEGGSSPAGEHPIPPKKKTGDGPPPGGGDGDEPEPGSKGPVAALRYFYAKLELTEQDRVGLWEKRGLTAATSEALGYRSNLASNKEVLLSMKEKFDVSVLLESGLWVVGDKAVEDPKPNAQFYGWGIVGKKPKAKTEEETPAKNERSEWEWDWTYPILIPYFDEAGELMSLRPHKGMMKDKSPRLYIVRRGALTGAKGENKVIELFEHEPEQLWSAPEGSRGWTPTYAVITEGEFKAAALWQVLATEAAIASVPGITMAKLLFGDIEQWLAEVKVRQAVVAYDNENKGDPKLPGFKANKWHRFDSEVWARYLCQQISKAGFEAKVAHLPDAWRDEKGKADWDGALAHFIQANFGKLAAPPETLGEGGVVLSEREKWERWVTYVWMSFSLNVRKRFQDVLKAGVRVEEMRQAGLFDSEEERIIRNKLERISYVSKLPVGGDQEVTISRRLHRTAGKLRNLNGSGTSRLPVKGQGFLMMLGKQYQETKGRYYKLKPLQEKKMEEWQKYLQDARDSNDVEVKRAAEIAVQGVPEPVSDFFMRSHYVLNRLNGTRERMVTLHNIHGVVSKMVPLTSDAFAQPSRYREWLLNQISGATWKAGERELNDLQADVAHEVAWKDVGEVAVRGYDEDSGIWFFGDVAYTPEGEEIFANEEGVVWHSGKGFRQGFRLSESDHEGQTFCQMEPLMKPKLTALELSPGGPTENKQTEEEVLRVLFQEMSQRMRETIGGYGGYLALGAMLAFAAAPEIYRRYTAFPGLWLHGETNQGKSSVAKWLLRLWGFMKDDGLSLPDSTKVGIAIALQQYGNLPVWLEEYQPDCPKWMQEKIKGIYNRESGKKKTFDEGDRKIRTSVIITGVATSQDSQVRSRYCHVPVAECNRLANHYDWFETESRRFFLLGRYLMRNRKVFAEHATTQMAKWIDAKGDKVKDARARIVHGASYGAFAGLALMLESHADLQDFSSFLLNHCQEAVGQVREQVNVNQFWTDLLAALTSDAFGMTSSERRRVFRIVKNDRAPSPVTPQQRIWGEEDARMEWTSYLLYFRPDPVIDMLRAYKRRLGRDLPLEKNDLRAQMKTRPYWVPGANKGDSIKFRYDGSNKPQTSWCIDLDKFEGLGFCPVADSEFEQSTRADGSEKFLPAMGEWSDPRMGDLYVLVDSLRPKQEQSQ